MRWRLPRLLQPLRRRDFALLSLGATVSLLGDGFFTVAIAWQVYKLSNRPGALSFVGLAWMLPTVLLLLVGGIVSDRFERRLVMSGADLIRAAAIGLIGLLSVEGSLRLWQMLVLMPFVGAGDAFFNPASLAIMPDLLPADELPQANALRGVLRPLMMFLIGPALGGLVVGVAGAGPAFLIDAASFLLSAIAVLGIAARRVARPVAGGAGRILREAAEGLRFVRAQPWCWATLAAASLGLLPFFGPWQVILPYLVKNSLQAGPQGLGLVYAVGGASSLLVSLVLGQTGLPRHRITVMYLAWALGIGSLAIFGIMTALWQALVAAVLLQGLFALGEIVWVTLLQQLVPGDLLGRVSSLDWLVSTSLVPLSFALTGPAASIFGARATIEAGGLLGGVLFSAFLFVPGVRDPERGQAGAVGARSKAGRV